MLTHIINSFYIYIHNINTVGYNRRDLVIKIIFLKIVSVKVV
jgi:hypothetical protein